MHVADWPHTRSTACMHVCICMHATAKTNLLFLPHSGYLASSPGSLLKGDELVVTLVVAELKRQWLCMVYFANCIRQPERKLPRPAYNQDLADIVTTAHLRESHLLVSKAMQKQPRSCRYSNHCTSVSRGG